MRSTPQVSGALRSALRSTCRNSVSKTALAASARRGPALQHAVSAKAFPAPAASRGLATVSDTPSAHGMHSLKTFTEEEEMLRDTARRFAEEVVQPKVYEMDENEKMDPEIIKQLFENGFMGIETAEEHGGANASFTSSLIVIEELAKIDGSVSVLCDVHNTLVNNLFRNYASKELQAKYLPKLATEMLGCFCLSEPSSGSDAFAMKTSYKKDNDGNYVINGGKMWITNSSQAELFIVFAQGDPSKGHKGISAFAVEKGKGVEVEKALPKLGIHASSTCPVTFEDCVVPKENLIGEEGKGYKIAIETLIGGRVGIGAQAVGIAQGAFDKAVRYTHEREQFGRPIGSFQSMQTSIAAAATKIEAARLLVYNAARLAEEGRPYAKEAMMAKVFAGEVAQSVTIDAINWCGGYGFERTAGIEKYHRDSMILSIYEGANNLLNVNISKMLTAEMGLGK